MNILKEVQRFIELSKSASDEALENSAKFANDFPHAEFEDYKKALEYFVKGYSYDKVVQTYRKNQQKLGAELAKKDYKRVLTMADCTDEMVRDLKKGKEKGTTTYIDKLDDAWSWKLGEFNIWTGYTNEGKSLFLRFLCLVKAIREKWKFAFYAPEDYPAKEFFDDIIHTAAGRSTDKDSSDCIMEDTYRKVIDYLKDYFFFVYLRPPENTLVDILKEFDKLIDQEGVKCCIIDPLIKVARPKEYMNADDKYAGYVTTLATDFARQTGISLHLVMHQLTPRLQENGLYPKPSYYNIKGGGTWVDGVDNVLSIQRPLYARDKIDDEVIFTSQKIKKQKLVGIPQEIKYRFDRRSNRYIDYDSRLDIFGFDEELGIGRMRANF